jgi:predicted ribosome quality control (RQC) complex YloA/Tae2 family protein
LVGKEFTSFDVAATVRELKTEVLDSILSNIYQLNAKTLLLKLHKADKPAFWLVLEAGRRINLTSYASEKPSTPPAFCMALRKYLRNARLASIEQYEFERVVIMSFKTQEGKMILILELFGDGNLILVGKNGKILQALTYKRMRDRDVIRGEAFKFAPSGGKNPNKINKEEVKTDLQSYGKVEAVRALARSLSIGGIYAEEALMRAGVEKVKICDLLSDNEFELIYASLQDLLSHIMNEPLQPCIILDVTDSLVDAVPLRLKRYESDLFKIQRCGTFNEALDQFYSKFSALGAVVESTKIDRLEAEAARLERIITDQKNVVTRSHAQAEHDKHIGDLVYGHFSELQTVLDKFLVEEKSEEELKQAVHFALDQKHKGVKPWTLFEAFDRKEFTIAFCVDGVQFSVNLQKTLFESAAEFYELGKRAKQKMEGAQTALNDSLKRLNEVQIKIRQAQQLELVGPAEAIEKLEKPEYVYDLTIEDNHNFIANNLFVHNSNITDALCFVLGRLSIKSIRAAKASHLIFSGNKEYKGANEAYVEIIFDNSDRSLVLDSDEVTIKRTVRHNGQGIYKINNETKTLEKEKER